jgi:phosphoribosylformimino-5-aminoimidazole carboxamide ribotide isomerase
MRIIPVIDLMAGQVVRGVAGRRKDYRPIQSPLVADPQPTTVARAFAALGFAEAYVADLDAIKGAEPAWDTYQAIASCGLKLWIDAGISTVQRAEQMASFSPAGEGRLAGIVVGLESLKSPWLIGDTLPPIGPDRFIFSLDIRGGKPITRYKGWQNAPPEAIGRIICNQGVRRMIVLDVARVGTNDGVGTEEICRSLREYCPGLELTAGGGIRGPDDLTALAEAGCNAALVASALHDGRILPHPTLKMGGPKYSVP